MLKNCTIYSWTKGDNMKGIEIIKMFYGDFAEYETLRNEIIPAYEVIFHDAYYDSDVDCEVLLMYKYILMELYSLDDFISQRELWE